ncbi:glycosyltransferase family 61 protein [Paracoccus sp. NSM]|uniref:glycosyltransferase family 61 protein n=1 Tax=Paracoccus sp. NSM TaxID=3457784 RepID=UPI004036167A
MQSFYIPGVDGPMVPHPDGTLHGTELGQAAVDVFDSRTTCPWPRIKGRDGMKSLHGTRRRNWIVRGSGIVPLTDAVCDQGGLFTAQDIPVMGFSGASFFRKFITKGKDYRAGAGMPRITERSLVVFMSETTNYYHFIADVMPNLARAIGAASSLDVEQMVIYGSEPEGGFRRDYLDLMLARLTIPVRYEAGPFAVDDGYFIVHSPHGFARDPDTGALLKLPQPSPYPFGTAEGMWDFFDAFDRGHVALPEAPLRAPILIVSRAHLENRKIVNEDALVDRLAPLGAERVILENYSLPEQIAMVRAARVLVGCHGAGMINGGFLGQGGRVIEITARQYAARSRDFARLSHVRPIRYSFILADEHGDRFQMTSNLGNNIIMSPQALDMVHEWASQTLAAKTD